MYKETTSGTGGTDSWFINDELDQHLIRVQNILEAQMKVLPKEHQQHIK